MSADSFPKLDLEALYNKAFSEEYLDELRRKEEEEHPTEKTLIIQGGDLKEGPIFLSPACWSPYFFLLRMTEKHRNSDRPGKKCLLWNRFFCEEAPPEQHQEWGISGITPLSEAEYAQLDGLFERYKSNFPEVDWGISSLKELKIRQRIEFSRVVSYN